jgi:hypothetical protein
VASPSIETVESTEPIVTTGGYTYESFAEFWANPHQGLTRAAELAHDDIVGYWPGSDEPVRGLSAYTESFGKSSR